MLINSPDESTLFSNFPAPQGKVSPWEERLVLKTNYTALINYFAKFPFFATQLVKFETCYKRDIALRDSFT